MKIVKTVLLIYLVSLFSVTILPRLSLFYALPHLILVISLLFIFEKEFKTGLLWALLGGLFLDFFGPKFPSNIFITTAIILLTIFLLQKFFESSNIYLFLTFCFFGSLVYDFLLLPNFQFSIFNFQLLSALYSTFFGFVIYLIYLRFQKRFRKSLI